MNGVDEHSPWNHSRPPDDGYGYRTRVKACSAVKSWLEFHHDVEFDSRGQNQIQNICEGEPPAFDSEFAEPHEVTEVFEDIADCSVQSCHPMTRVSYDAIMRRGEVVRAKWEDYQDGRLYMRTLKGSKPRWIEFSPKTVEVLEEYRDHVRSEFDDPTHLFYHGYGRRWNQPWTADGWGKHFRIKHWSPGAHSFTRHSPITNRLASGQSVDAVFQRARHKNLSTTLRYLQFVSNDVIPPELQ
jgi:integrase